MDKINKQLNTLINEVKELKNQIKGLEKRIFPAPQIDTRSTDELYEEAKKIVVKGRKASTSYLQRKLGIGYARSACLIDMLEDKGVIGPALGAVPRKVLIKSNKKIITLIPTKGKNKEQIKKEIVEQLKTKGVAINKK